jgi:hypothetical protein
LGCRLSTAIDCLVCEIETPSAWSGRLGCDSGASEVSEVSEAAARPDHAYGLANRLKLAQRAAETARTEV